MMGLIDLNQGQLRLPELARYEVKIAALSLAWLTEEGQFSQIDTGYTFFWIGCSKHEQCEAGGGFAVK